jgi:hypothetical protein
MTTFLVPETTEKYTLYIKKRNYSAWSWICEETLQPISEEELPLFPQPICEKLFHGDQYCNNTKEILRCSPIRTEKSIPGTLVLEGNRSYGRQIVNNKMGRLYYRCIPKSIHYPIFLLPYKPVVEFSKMNVNMFVVFEYKEWKERTAPYGGLIETIGAVNHLPSYYRYLLVSNCLEFHPNHWIPLPAKMPAIHSAIGTPSIRPKKGEPLVFSIDPKESRDLDDAFSFHREAGVAVVNIYIADVVYWIDALNAWDVLRMENLGCTTIYLPGQNHPLLPRWLSDKKGSLLEGETHPVLQLELMFRLGGGGGGKWVLESHQFCRNVVKIHKNFRYDTMELEACSEYREFLKFTRGCGYFEEGIGGKEIRDSHDLVEIWMIEYNIFAANRLCEFGAGIFRKTVDLGGGGGGWGGEELQEHFPGCSQFLKHYKKMRGEYILFVGGGKCGEDGTGEIEKYSHTNIRGEGHNIFYAHASSPLRRMVDIYNQLCLIRSLRGSVGEIDALQEKQEGFKQWMEVSVEEINVQNRKIRRIQTECEMLADFFSEDKVGASELYDGVVVDLEIRKKGEEMETKGYWVFLEQWKRLVYVEKQEEDASVGRGQIGKYQIFLFEEEEKAHKKIICRHCV